MTRERLAEILGRFPSLSVAVFGDFYLDKYLIIDPALGEPSLETGLEARQVVEVRCSPGAAGTVASNLAALGVGRVLALGLIGRDGEGFELVRELKSRGIDTRGLAASDRRRTPTYMKPMAEGRELERLDMHNRTPPASALQRRLVGRLSALLPRLNGVFVADQCTVPECGVVTVGVRDEISRLAAARPATTFLADSRANIGEFRAMVLKPNLSEAAGAVGVPEPQAERAGEYGLLLAERARAGPVFVTVGGAGIVVCAEAGAVRVPTAAAEGPIDIVGAGDAGGAGLLASLCAGASPVEAAEVANLAAGVTIRKLGTTGTASPPEILDLYDASARLSPP
jgi:rfaE bifunctional protein kinase chain/domain